VADNDARIGVQVAGYRLEAVLGRGGMGVVYLAADLRLGRPVAVKLLAPELAADQTLVERFLRESQIAASIDHPHVIPLYEAGEDEGVLFIAMRYVDGSDLRHVLLRDGRLQPERAVRIVCQIASGLDVAHERGLVHRDVKPGNILVGGRR
jgi:serine/threonine protein kinase